MTDGTTEERKTAGHFGEVRIPAGDGCGEVVLENTPRICILSGCSGSGKSRVLGQLHNGRSPDTGGAANRTTLLTLREPVDARRDTRFELAQEAGRAERVDGMIRRGVSRRWGAAELADDGRNRSVRMRPAAGGEPLAVPEWSGGVTEAFDTAITAAAAETPVLLIDDAGARLHPRGCTALAKLLAELSAETDTQLFVATHRLEITTGLLEAVTEPDDLAAYILVAGKAGPCKRYGGRRLKSLRDTMGFDVRWL